MFEEQEEKKSGRHIDESKNFTYYERMIVKIHPLGTLNIMVTKDFEGPLYSTFAFRDHNDDQFAHPISFHQEHRAFRVEMCNCLNFLGRNGFLERIDVPKHTPEWEKLFGKND